LGGLTCPCQSGNWGGKWVIVTSGVQARSDKVLVYVSTREASTTHHCVETGSQEAAAIYFTSGTSGPPKMVEHSHASLGIKAQMDAR
jgi:acyl-coenzyme A synthetase/AMP-(fatty) acid ligase